MQNRLLMACRATEGSGSPHGSILEWGIEADGSLAGEAPSVRYSSRGSVPRSFALASTTLAGELLLVANQMSNSVFVMSRTHGHEDGTTDDTPIAIDFHPLSTPSALAVRAWPMGGTADFSGATSSEGKEEL